MSTPLQAARPDDDAWLGALLEESPLVPERGQVEAWRRVLPHLPPSLRYELAAVLRETSGAIGRQQSAISSDGHLPTPETRRPTPDTTWTRRLALQAWARWERAAGPWVRWSLCLPLLAPGLDELSELPPFRPLEAARRIARTVGDDLHHHGPAVVILDLDPVLGVQVAGRLSRTHQARPVLYLARWPYAHAVLACESLVAALLAESRRLTPRKTSNVVGSSESASGDRGSTSSPRTDQQGAPIILRPVLSPPKGLSKDDRDGFGVDRGAVFVLDAERSAVSGQRPPLDPRADNRYDVAAHDLPGVVALRANGVSRVLDVRKGGSEPPTELVRYAYPAYERAGVSVSRLTV